MKKNMGTADRWIRVILASLFVILYFGNYVTGTWGIVLLAVAAIFFITALMSSCPLYSLLGISTCPRKTSH